MSESYTRLRKYLEVYSAYKASEGQTEIAEELNEIEWGLQDDLDKAEELRSQLQQKDEELAQCKSMVEKAPEPVSNANKEWEDNYAKWHEDALAALEDT